MKYANEVYQMLSDFFKVLYHYAYTDEYCLFRTILFPLEKFAYFFLPPSFNHLLTEILALTGIYSLNKLQVAVR